MKISDITGFLENAYGVLNKKYFEGSLTPVVITVQSSPRTYGHYTTYNAWAENAEGFREINISAENLARPIENVIATLIHEMVHHYCDMNNIKDVSRGGTYHNKRFKEQAEMRDLIITYSQRIGFSHTEPSPALIEFVISQGWECVDLSRVGTPETISIGGGNSGRKTSSTRKYKCPECGCSVRATKSVNIGCLDCGVQMELVEK